MTCRKAWILRTILVTAYDVNPYKGSESATGWNFIVQIARFNHVVAVTRQNNRADIERYIKQEGIDDSRMHFYYYDLPLWARWWKRKSRGSSIYFYLWQMFLPFFVKSNQIRFDFAHGLNFHSDSCPCFLWVFEKPFIWGPISHHEKIPRGYIWKRYQLLDYIEDRLRWGVKKVQWSLDLFLRITCLRANRIFVGHSAVSKRLLIDLPKTVLFNQVAAEECESFVRDSSKQFEVLFVGRFVPLKAPDIAIKAFALFLDQCHPKNVTLKLVGRGGLGESMRKLISDLHIEKYVQIVDWVDKGDLNNIYKQASLFLFPSHEGAGMVVAEALSYGLPIVCFDNYGPGELVNDECAVKVPYTNYEHSVQQFAEVISKLFYDRDRLAQMSLSAIKLFKEKYSWTVKGDALRRIYDSLYKKN